MNNAIHNTSFKIVNNMRIIAKNLSDGRRIKK